MMSWVTIFAPINFGYILLVSYIRLENNRYQKLILNIRNSDVFHRFKHERKPDISYHQIDNTEKQKRKGIFHREKSRRVKTEFNILYYIIYFIISQLRVMVLYGFIFVLLDSERPIGRPKIKHARKPKFVHIRKDLAEKLEAEAKNSCLTQTNIIEIALDKHFTLSSHSEQQLVKRKEELEREINNINSTLLDKMQKAKQEQIQKEKEDKELLETYKRFCHMLDNVMDEDTIPILDNFIKNYGLKITEEEFQHICNQHQKKQFTFEDFKNMRNRSDVND